MDSLYYHCSTNLCTQQVVIIRSLIDQSLFPPAVSVDDYTAISFLRKPDNEDLKFARTGTEVSVTITITNDAVCEPTETFELVMVPTNNFFAVKPVGVVTILDDDTRKLGIVGEGVEDKGGRE